MRPTRSDRYGNLPTVLIWERSYRRTDQLFRLYSKCARHLEYQAKRWHVLTALDLSHVRALDASFVSQLFLSYSRIQTRGPNGRTKRLRNNWVACGHALGSPTLHGPFVHRAERVVASLAKPRYV